MPMSMMMPTNPYMSRSMPTDQQREQRAERRERQPGENRDRVNEALVQHAEDHVDHEDRERDQDEQSLLRRLVNAAAVPEKLAAIAGGSVCCGVLLDRVDRRAQRDAAARG